MALSTAQAAEIQATLQGALDTLHACPDAGLLVVEDLRPYMIEATARLVLSGVEVEAQAKIAQALHGQDPACADAFFDGLMRVGMTTTSLVELVGHLSVEDPQVAARGLERLRTRRSDETTTALKILMRLTLQRWMEGDYQASTRLDFLLDHPGVRELAFENLQLNRKTNVPSRCCGNIVMAVGLAIQEACSDLSLDTMDNETIDRSVALLRQVEDKHFSLEVPCLNRTMDAYGQQNEQVVPFTLIEWMESLCKGSGRPARAAGLLVVALHMLHTHDRPAASLGLSPQSLKMLNEASLLRSHVLRKSLREVSEESVAQREGDALSLRKM